MKPEGRPRIRLYVPRWHDEMRQCNPALQGVQLHSTGSDATSAVACKAARPAARCAPAGNLSDHQHQHSAASADAISGSAGISQRGDQDNAHLEATLNRRCANISIGTGLVVYAQPEAHGIQRVGVLLGVDKRYTVLFGPLFTNVRRSSQAGTPVYSRATTKATSAEDSDTSCTRTHCFVMQAGRNWAARAAPPRCELRHCVRNAGMVCASLANTTLRCRQFGPLRCGSAGHVWMALHSFDSLLGTDTHQWLRALARAALPAGCETRAEQYCQC
jgi:hypothetical protein